jgi:DNA-binding transcriptional LysR family regulator
LKSIPYRHQTEALLHGASQVGITVLPVSTIGITTICLLREPVVVVLPCDHKLARKRQLFLSDLAGEPVAWFARELHPDFFEHTLARMSSFGYTPLLREEVQSVSEALGHVLGGSRIMFITRSDSRLQPPGTVVKPLAEEKLTIDTGLASASSCSSRVVSEIVRNLKDRYGSDT